MKKFVFLLVLAVLCCEGWSQADTRMRMAFWNVENFFDTKHDTLKDDMAFTPQGANHWTQKRYEDKRNKIYKIVAAMEWPVVMGMAEIENEWVLRDLCLGTPLRKMGYDYVHYESPDVRGVDCAMIYRRDKFKVLESKPICVSDSSENFFTRDILMVKGLLKRRGGDDTCYLFVNHWPSKLGGATADRHRLEIAQKLLTIMDSLNHCKPGALILAMGDFNASPDEEAISKGLEFENNCSNIRGLYNLVYQIENGIGSYKYQGVWSCIDQMICNQDLEFEIFAPEVMLENDVKYMGKKLFRTYLGMWYRGGYSDHLPIIVSLP